MLNFMFCSVVICFSVFASWSSGKLFVVTCRLDNQYCMLLVRIIVVNIIMIDIHANMRVSKQSGGNVRPD
jgi:hypothetical protein